MDALISLMNHPYLTMKLGHGEESKRNIDAIYPITLFFAFGIYLVYERYQQTHNRPIAFDWPVPDVSPSQFSTAIFSLTLFVFAARRPYMDVPSNYRADTGKPLDKPRHPSPDENS